MGNVAVRIENIGKCYQLGEAQGQGTLRDMIPDAFERVLNRKKNHDKQEFWALKDVSFELKWGDVVGLIGRNGAGKSTLLKILARITTPTTGKGEVFGRVGSLLEVGTGFHPELTGRENIFLNGSILGMRRREILKKFDSIVDFAEISQFIDTPVKRYSSGMYTRLAFAVAAHLETDILIVDEVLAVGDAAFQRKCLGSMDNAVKQGRTVVFVSHHMPSVTRLCKRGILLEQGSVKLDSDITSVSGAYLRSDLGTSAERKWESPEVAPGDDTVRLKSVRILSEGKVTETIDIRNPITVEMEYWNLKPGTVLFSSHAFFDDAGTCLFVAADFDRNQVPAKPKEKGTYLSRCTIPGNLFAEGQIRVAPEVGTSKPAYAWHVLERDCVSFQVIDSGEPGSVRNGWGRPLPGVMRPTLQWDCQLIDKEYVLKVG